MRNEGIFLRKITMIKGSMREVSMGLDGPYFPGDSLGDRDAMNVHVALPGFYDLGVLFR